MEDHGSSGPTKKASTRSFDPSTASAEDFVAYMRGVGLPI